MGVLNEIQLELENSAMRLMAEHRNRLYAEALKLCENHADAEDLVLQTLDDGLRNFDQCASKESPFSWLKAILENNFRAGKRRAVNRGTFPVDPTAFSENETLSDTATEEDILRHSDSEALKAALGRLDEKYKQVVVMHYLADLPVKDIAAVLHIPVGTVLWRLNMARKILARDLSEKLGKKGVLAVLIGLVLAGGLFASWGLGVFDGSLDIDNTQAKEEKMKATSLITAAALMAGAGGTAADVRAADAAYAAVYHVDAERGNDETGAGTEASPYQTIQKAVDKAADSSIIYVHPGEYRTGATMVKDTDQNEAGLSRVFVFGKTLRIESTDGAATTHIVGAHDSTTTGRGANAVRCVAHYGTGDLTLKGFTLRDGATSDVSANAPPSSRGGAVFAWYNQSHPTRVIDCVVSNCVSCYGTLQGVTAIRTLVCDNAAVRYVGSRQCELYNCIFTRNRCAGDGIVGESGGKAVNCTIVNNDAPYAARTVTTFHNCLVSFSHNESVLYAVTDPSHCVTSADQGDIQTLAPAFGDFRVLKGSAAETAGDPALLAASSFSVKVPEEELNRDFFGNAIDTTKPTVCAGAIQEVVAPAAGGVAFAGLSRATGCGLRVEGADCFYRDGLYAFPETWPVQWKVQPVLPAGQEAFGFTPSVDKLYGRYRFPQMDGSVLLIPPVATGVVETNTLNLSKKVVWAKPDADASVADGTEARPYRTLQAATDAVANYDYPIVHLKRGTYAEGERFGSGISNRVVLADWKYIRYVGDEGPENTFIVGAPDPTTGGNGPNATRAFCTGGSAQSCIQGVTITGCYTDSDSGTTSAQGSVARGGGTRTLFLCDCVISNNFARNGLIVNAVVLRSRVVGNRPYDTLLYDSQAAASYFADNKATGRSMGSALFSGTPHFFCTVRDAAEESGDIYGYYASQNATPFGCVFSGGNAYNPTKGAGNLTWEFPSHAATAVGYTVGDPQFAYATGGELLCTSPALTCTVVPTASNAGATVDGMATGDIDGNKFRVVDGKFAAGAFQTFLTGVVTVSAPAGGLTVTGGKVGVNYLPSGSLTISRGSGTRPCVGVAVGNVTNLFDEVGSVTITAEQAQTAEAIDVAAIYSNAWYVNPDPFVGSDANSGFTAKVPFLTLTNAMAHAVSGDVVYAAPGTYREGSAIQSGGQYIRARVVIPSGVSLVSAEGAAKTFIEGAKASDPDQWGCGEDAIRCVYMNSGTLLKGFTVTNGFSYAWEGSIAGVGNPDYCPEFSGGGIQGTGAANHASTIVEDCVIVGNSARRSACRYATFVNCRFDGNYSWSGGTAGGESSFYNCVIGVNYGQRAIICYYKVMNTTIAPQLTSDGKAGALAIDYANSTTESRVANLLCLGVGGEHSMSEVERSFFAEGSAVPAEKLADGSRIVPLAELAVDENLRPVPGGCCGIDQAKTNDAEVMRHVGARDVSGSQRVYNGAMDVGALEADWRARYARDLTANRRFAVTEASPDVTESEVGTVRMPVASTLETSWTNRVVGETRDYRYTVRIVGDCQLVAKYGDQEFFRLTGPVEKAEIPKSVDASALDRFSFECVAGESGEGYAEVTGAFNPVGFILMVR